MIQGLCGLSDKLMCGLLLSNITYVKRLFFLKEERHLDLVGKLILWLCGHVDFGAVWATDSGAVWAH